MKRKGFLSRVANFIRPFCSRSQTRSGAGHTDQVVQTSLANRIVCLLSLVLDRSRWATTTSKGTSRCEALGRGRQMQVWRFSCRIFTRVAVFVNLLS